MSGSYDHQVEVVVGVMIVRDEQVLLIQSPKWKDIWIFPGGHVEYGEHLFQAAEREAKEETGLTVHGEQVMHLSEDVLSPSFHRPAHMIAFQIMCRADQGDVEIEQREITRAEWFDYDTALTLPLLPSNQAAIRRMKDGMSIPFTSRN